MIRMLKDLFISMRPQQWYKNFLVFAALVFSKNLLDLELLKLTILGFIAFCLASSSQYIFNDILDREKDKRHPKKCKRPIASGKISLPIAIAFSAILLIFSILISLLLNFWFLMAIISYLILNSLYSAFLKNLVLFDVLTISAGFVIRAISGCFIINVLISPWLILCTFLLAIFLALGKRRHELILLEENAKKHREVLGLYSKEAVDQMLSIMTMAGTKRCLRSKFSIEIPSLKTMARFTVSQS
ncbi:MAG: decaprenyl-phosphate phosphoribosyltransferase [Archaeoglobaceae archaeon]|nr:decaprenyl-phosphate phosphoribosyltransferase [Archaeoglobaceae archaeon]MDW7989925.1 decaprenyl-phosphate phosphoribosyltransferase [Archaeoglobaceae archaeon]